MIPAKEDLAPNEVAIRVHDDLPDDLGRYPFVAYWLNSMDEVSDEEFYTNLEDFANVEHCAGNRVTALDERTHKVLDGIGLVVPSKEGETR